MGRRKRKERDYNKDRRQNLLYYVDFIKRFFFLTSDFHACCIQCTRLSFALVACPAALPAPRLLRPVLSTPAGFFCWPVRGFFLGGWLFGGAFYPSFPRWLNRKERFWKTERQRERGKESNSTIHTFLKILKGSNTPTKLSFAQTRLYTHSFHFRGGFLPLNVAGGRTPPLFWGRKHALVMCFSH